MGPYYLTAIVALLGPVRRVAGFASMRTLERAIEIGPRAGTPFTAATPTHASAVMELDGGRTANLVASFEAVDQYICDLEIHGTEGVLALPDPNAFEGPVRVKAGRGEWREVPYPAAGGRDARGIGLHDLVEAVAAGQPHRASALLGLHVVEVARGVLRSAELGSAVTIDSSPEQPAPRPSPQAVG
jgi:predicted dehydrogenase